MTDDLAKQLRAARESGDPWAAWHLALQTADRIEKLEAALEKISRERTLWGAMRKADHALGKFEHKALEGKDDPQTDL
jgi:hypothetical protein